jgi:hypothetical protein
MWLIILLILTIGPAVIRDISTGREKEDLSSLFRTSKIRQRPRLITSLALTQLVLLFSLLASPVLGGLFTQLVGFRVIFWFLSIVGGTTLLLVIIFLLETNRHIAGNGTIRLRAIQRPLFSIIRPTIDAPFMSDQNESLLKPTLKPFLEPLRCFKHKAIIPSIFLDGIAFAILATVVSTTALLFPPRYHLPPILIGVAYLPSGVGCVAGFFLMTYRLGSDYQIFEARHNARRAAEYSSLESDAQSNFPIERARLRSAWWIMLIFVGTTIGYGFSLSAPSVIRLLVLQFFISGNATAILLVNSVLIKDLHPSTSVTAAINLVRFSLAGLMIGVIQLVFNRLGTGFTFLALGALMLALTPIMIVQWINGGKRGINKEAPSTKVAPRIGIVL